MKFVQEHYHNLQQKNMISLMRAQEAFDTRSGIDIKNHQMLTKIMKK